jgi:hypothetical protein
MAKSRLNRRINAVRKNIVVKKNLLTMLEKIKEERNKVKKTRKIKKKNSSNTRITIKKQASKTITPLNGRNVVSSLELPYLKKIKKINVKPIVRRSKSQSKSKNPLLKNKKLLTKEKSISMDNSNYHICRFKNFHEEHIEIPHTYPGDLWVHNNLLADRDKPLDFFEEEYLKEVYSNHRKICYGI